MSLALQYLPALQKSERQLPLVLLHGWGIDSSIWGESLLLGLRQQRDVVLLDLPGFGRNQGHNLAATASLNDYLAAIDAALPAQCLCMGFSLGGMLAVQLAASKPSKIQALVTVAANARFVASAKWPSAMPVEQFQQFCLQVQQSHESGLKRFAGLQAKGCDQERVLLKQLRHLSQSSPYAVEALLPQLDHLAAIDNSQLLPELACPTLHIYGEADHLIPAAAAVALQQRGVSAQLIAGAAHTPWLSHPADFANALEPFLQTCQFRTPINGSSHSGDEASNQAIQDTHQSTVAIQQAPTQDTHKSMEDQKQSSANRSVEQLNPASLALRDKRLVARSFSMAADSYDRYAGLQKKVSDHLLTSVELGRVSSVLDLGCGTGYMLPRLATVLDCQPLGLDLAEGMVQYARQQGVAAPLICADAECLPLADESLELIYSSLAIQWSEDLPQLFKECSRVLRPGGRMLFSTLGPNTLHELRAAWAAVDQRVHVNSFADRECLMSAIAEASLACVNFSEQIEVLQYQQLSELTTELKGIGAHNVNPGRSTGLTGRARIKQWKRAYERQRNSDGMLPASYQVWYGALLKTPLTTAATSK